jgi:hypothetical protein
MPWKKIIMCEYWTEAENGGGQSYECCKKTGKAVSCSGLQHECNNGQYLPQEIPNREGEPWVK